MGQSGNDIELVSMWPNVETISDVCVGIFAAGLVLRISPHSEDSGHHLIDKTIFLLFSYSLFAAVRFVDARVDEFCLRTSCTVRDREKDTYAWRSIWGTSRADMVGRE